ncbi:adenylate/guanylate cyclase domain-containing protein [Novosphingobium sp. ES2-1]|jgi:adenylate cyclase|uniref:adenylate/guanylate cyclase domain-containing protein n=1 Tax=Novosphingobium sp. ES2-1 TaxID=2780074 RepID=UPI00187F6E25|nr:adenylate/guanylate cyclase domain-containing protein [Novosphingobium sp. ES2-1]QOV93249.1 adenylate/guanylate cyclase domain-containing protein [Novosphingobium sp. ES2-1]
MEQPGVFSTFHDAATEARYNETARTLRTPFVRLYAVLFMAVMLAYSVINPLYLDPVENARLAFWLGIGLMCIGAYIGATFWQDYVRHPMVDFTALLVISLIVARINFVLFDHLLHIHTNLHAVGVINRLAITAFAAVTLAGRPHLFLGWLGCDLLGWLGQVIPEQTVDAAVVYALLSYLSGALVMAAINLAVGRTSRAAFMLADSLDAERARNEELVLNMLPTTAVERIRTGQMVADSYADASVIFIDMVGFSKLTKRVSPGHLVELLNSFFNHADACAREFGVEKVKTVGDAYLAIAGGNIPSGNSADAAIAFARAVLSGVEELKRVAGVDEVGLRAGIHSGPVVGGVIGATRMAYDYWGDTVNIAARLEGTAAANGIAISESTWLRANDRGAFGPPMMMTLKGIGETCVFQAVVEEADLKMRPAAA